MRSRIEWDRCRKRGDFLRDLVLFGMFFFLFTSCEEEKKKGFVQYDGPIEVIHNIHFLFTESGNLKVEMITPEQRRYKNENKIYPDSVHINFFDDQGNMITTLRADSGRFDNTTKLYIVKGNVVVNRTVTNDVLKTTELVWNPTSKKVYNDKPNFIRNLSDGKILNGVGMEADQDFSTLAMKRISDSRFKSEF